MNIQYTYNNQSNRSVPENMMIQDLTVFSAICSSLTRIVPFVFHSAALFTSAYSKETKMDSRLSNVKSLRNSLLFAGCLAFLFVIDNNISTGGEAPNELATEGQPQYNMIKQVQKKLKEAGYDPGSIDGYYGRRTQSAIRQYQQDKGLQVSGILDDRTLEKLGLK